MYSDLTTFHYRILSETSRRTLKGQNLSCGGIIKTTRPTDIFPHICTQKTPSEEISTKEKGMLLQIEYFLINIFKNKNGITQTSYIVSRSFGSSDSNGALLCSNIASSLAKGYDTVTSSQPMAD